MISSDLLLNVCRSSKLGEDVLPLQGSLDHAGGLVHGQEDLVVALPPHPRELGEVDGEVVLVRHSHGDALHLREVVEDAALGQVHRLLHGGGEDAALGAAGEDLQDLLLDL